MLKKVVYKVNSGKGTIRNIKWDISKNLSHDSMSSQNFKYNALMSGSINKSATHFNVTPHFELFLGSRQSMVSLDGKLIDDKTISVQFVPSFNLYFTSLFFLIIVLVALIESEIHITPAIIFSLILIYKIARFFFDLRDSEKLCDRLMEIAQKRHSSEISQQGN
ncbi:hypothetical protein [Ekhidna sp.]